MRSHERGDHINFVSEEFIGSRSTMLLQHRQHIPFSANGRSHKLCATPSSLVTASSTCSSSRVRQQQLRGCRPAARLAPQPCRAAASDMSLPDPQQRSTSPGDIVSDTGNVLDPQAVSSWLSQYLPFKIISPSSVDLLAELVQVEFVPAGKMLTREGMMPEQLVVVRQGAVQVTGGSLPVPIDAGPGASFFLIELLLGQPSSTTVRSTCDCTLWVVPGKALLQLASQRPDLALELGLRMSQGLKQQLGQLQAAQQSEERRARALQPYLVSTPKRGVVGNSKYADRLRRQVLAAAKDPERKPVKIFGEPGLEKDNIAALLHFGSPDRTKPMVKVDCLEMDPYMTELFGRGSREGLLHWLRDGTLVINNVHKAQTFMLPQLKELLQNGTYQPAPGSVPLTLGSLEIAQAERTAKCRVILTAEQTVPYLDNLCTVIKVPPLRVRPADILDLERYYMRVISKEQGVKLTLTQEAERALLAYSFPENITELESLVRRAVVQVSKEEAKGGADQQASSKTKAPSDAIQTVAADFAGFGVAPKKGGVFALDKDVFWFAKQSKDRFRWNMLNPFPLLRQLLLSDIFPELINHKIVKPVFAVVVTLLFVCPQDRDHNFCLSLFWNYWWPIMFIIYPFIGRIWCSICPFMIYGEVMQRWRTAQGVVLRKWPKEEMEAWGGWFLFGLFAAILVWEEVWDLPQTAYLSSWLLLLITAGAVVCSAFFERRLWCRFLCPIGGMNGLFAKLSMTELRARQGVCSGTCNTYHCYKGGPAEGEGQETGGCPVYSHPAQLTDNRNCVLCMTCLKACPHRSIEFRLRLPGVDLWTTHKPAWSEVMLQFMLLGAVYLHNIHELQDQFGIDPSNTADKLPHIAASIAVMSVPGLIAWGADASMRLAYNAGPLKAASRTLSAITSGGDGDGGGGGGAVGAAAGQLAVAGGGAAGGSPTGAAMATTSSSVALAAPLVPFLNLSYGYLPLVWGATLSYYLKPLLEEAGRILPVTAATFGGDGDGLPTFAADHSVTLFLQGSALLLGTGLSLMLTRKVGQKPWLVLTPQCLTILGFTAELYYLIIR